MANGDDGTVKILSGSDYKLLHNLVSDLAISGDTDDLFYDARRKRLYLSCGEGFIDTIEQNTPDSYKAVSKLPTAPSARTSFFSPALDRLYLAVPERGAQEAEIRVYQPQ